MTKTEYKMIEAYMQRMMRDSAHDKHHVYRVLNTALDIADHTEVNDKDVLIAACLLHDIGRDGSPAGPDGYCHAEAGGKAAFKFLLSIDWPEDKTLHVKECIASHRYRGNASPQSVEAKILYDADKLDASGALGIARTLIYEGQVTEPLYIMDTGGNIVTDGGGGGISSFFQEYNYKLKNVYTAFYTERAEEIALKRQKTAIGFYNGLYDEITENYTEGISKRLSLSDG